LAFDVEFVNERAIRILGKLYLRHGVLVDATEERVRVGGSTFVQHNFGTGGLTVTTALPTDVPPRVVRRPKEMADSLKDFGGTRIAFEFVDDESLAMAKQLAAISEVGGWKVDGISEASKDSLARFRDLIALEINTGPREDGDRADDAAYLLAVRLDSEGIEAGVAPAHPPLPFNTIRFLRRDMRAGCAHLWS
jgi:hypothetical protein